MNSNINPFQTNMECEQHYHTLKDISELDLQQWEAVFRRTGLTRQVTSIPISNNTNDKATSLHNNFSSNRELINCVNEELKSLESFLTKPHLFILTNQNGIAIHIQASYDILQSLSHVNIDVGTNFDMESIGINAISVAMKLGGTAIVYGKEHSLQLFSHWSCICMPIKIDGEIIGYLDMSFDVETDVTLAIALLHQIIVKIEHKLHQLRPKRKQEIVFAQFDLVGLTPREKQVGYGWLHNQSILRISEELGISEGTVRNMLKKVYVKTKVGDKGQFIRKFM